MLDIDHGTYPFVTSSSATSGGAVSELASLRRPSTSCGVTKAYCTRVGGGPFPTEAMAATGDLRGRGQRIRRGDWPAAPLRLARFATLALRWHD